MGSTNITLATVAVIALTKLRDRVTGPLAVTLDGIIATLVAEFLGGIRPQFGGGGGPR